MGIQIWFRGEGVGVAASRAGGDVHDFDDGVYYTDSYDVAKSYAQMRSTQPGNERVYQVSVEMKNIRVLDLTTHPEWEKLMKSPLLPSQPKGPTTEQFLRSAPASQNYNGFFRMFLKNAKLDLKDFDAVIGPEFIRGGKQMCILHKDGVPSAIANNLKSIRVPVNSKPVPATPVGRLRFQGKIGPGLKSFVKGTAMSLAAGAALMLVGWLLQKFLDELQLKNIAKKVEEDASHRLAEIAEIQSSGRNAYVNVTIELFETEQTVFVAGFADTQMVSTQQYRLANVEISDKNINKPFADKWDKIERITGSVTYYTTASTNSMQVGLSDDEIDLYKAYKNEILWYENTLSQVSAEQDVRRLSREKMELEAKFRATFQQ